MPGTYSAFPSQFFRASIGVGLVSADGDVLALERALRLEGSGLQHPEYIGTGQWQLPQGRLGLDEEPGVAAMRLLGEDLGLNANDVEPLFEMPGWLNYELPPGAQDTRNGRGQCQKWFFYHLLSDEQRIDLSRGLAGRDFKRFAWMPLRSLAEKTWVVRRPIYKDLADALDCYLLTSTVQAVRPIPTLKLSRLKSVVQ